MNTKLIEEIFFSIAQPSEENTKEWNRIVKPSSDTIHKKYIEPLEETDEHKAGEMESDINEKAAACELLGFVQGFKYAMRLKTECERM